MTSTSRTAARHDRGGYPATLRERFHTRMNTRMNRRRGDNERGDMLMDTLIWMAVIALTVAAFAASAQAANRVQRQSLATDVVDQQAKGVLAAAQAQPWALLAQDVRDPNIGAGTDPAERPLVLHRDDFDAAENADLLQPLTEVTTRGVTMTQRVWIAWESGQGLYSRDDPARYGTKVVTVRISYTVIGGSTSPRTKTFSIKRSSTVAEAVPVTLASLDDSNNTPILPPVAALACPSVWIEGNDLVWDAVPGAAHYFVSGRNAGGSVVMSEETVRDTRTTLNGRGFGPSEALSMQFKVEPGNRATRANCDWVTPRLGNPNLPPLTCPTNVRIEGNMLKWDAVTGATRYFITVADDGGDFITDQVVTATQWGATWITPSPSLRWKVDASDGSRRSPDCSYTTITTDSGASNLTCPSNVRLDGNYLRWDPVSGAVRYLVSVRDSGGNVAATDQQSSTNEWTSAMLTYSTGLTFKVDASNGTSRTTTCTWSTGGATAPSGDSCVNLTVNTRSGALSWNPVNGASQYRVERYVYYDPEFPEASTTTTDTTYEDEYTSSPNYYTFTVTGIGGRGEEFPQC